MVGGEHFSKFQLPSSYGLGVEEVSMKWKDRPSVTEMERGGVYEMEIEISSIHLCGTWSGYVSLSVPGPTQLIFCWIQK